MEPPRRFEGVGRLFLHPDDYRRYVSGIDRGVVKLRASQLGKVHELVADFLDLAADLFAGLHSQLDYLPDIFLKNAKYRVTRLKINFALGEKTAAGKGENESNKN